MQEQEYKDKIKQIAYKPESEVTEEERRLRAIEKVRCKNSFLYWLGYAKIADPPTLDNIGGLIKFELWEHLKKVVAALLTEKLITVCKARQIGLSWLMAAYALWFAMSHQSANIMLFSKGEAEAIELLAKCKRLYMQLPPFLKLHINPDSATMIGFPVMMSAIKAFAATETAGVGETASVIICDEWDLHPYADQNYLQSKPTRDAGGQFVGVFTVDKLNPDTLAKAIWLDGNDKKNDFVAQFFPWTVRPGRDEAWYASTKRNIPERELAKLSPELYMEQNYPSSWEEAFARSETVAVFDKRVLNAMKDDVRSPINIDREGIDNDIVHIYKDYHIGNFYIAGTDVSLGVGKDFNITCVMDVKTGDIVADIMSQHLSPDELTLHSIKMLEIYHNPLWWIEENLWGRTVVAKALELGYRRLGYRDERKTKAGFVTDDKSRGDLFGALIPAINDHQIRIYNQAGLEQFYGIIRNADKKGKIEAMSSKHDDYVIAVGLCWLKKGDVKTNVEPMKPIESITFRSYRPLPTR